jgi:hypothetical protein
MYLTAEKQAALQRVVLKGTKKIDEIAAQLRGANPAAFHTTETLPERVFFHEPPQLLPYHRCIRYR